MRPAAAEAQMRVRAALDVEPLGVIEDVLVEIGRPVEQADPLPGLDLLAAQDGVDEGGALEYRHGGRPADDLVDRGLRPLGPEQLPLVRVVQEGQHPVRDRVAGGLVARHGKQDHEEAELVR